MSKRQGPRILVFDIETSPILGYVWGLFDQNIGLSQIFKDWHILSFSAKWLDEKQVMYFDQRGKKNLEDDKELLTKIWKLLDQADVVITQNGVRFDSKKLNARFAINGMKPPSKYRHIDTLKIAKKNFAFTSNKLEYMTDKLCTKHKKMTKRKYAGFDLWKECLKGNIDAWKEMETYNKLDVLSLEELYYKLIPWDSSINFDVYHDAFHNVCKCGSTESKRNGFAYTNNGKYQRFKCVKCGSETRSKKNLLLKEKRETLRSGT